MYEHANALVAGRCEALTLGETTNASTDLGDGQLFACLALDLLVEGLAHGRCEPHLPTMHGRPSRVLDDSVPIQPL